MIARIIEASVRNRFLVYLLVVLLAGAGLQAIRTLPVDAVPDLSDVQVIVVTDAPGRSPQVVEEQVTVPLTSTLLAVPHARVVRGWSYFGYSLVYVLFDEGTDLYQARTRVLEYLDRAAAQLPEGITPQLGPDATGVGWIYQYTLTDFGPRARVLRQVLDTDGDGEVGPAELPSPGEDGIYPEARLQALFDIDDPPLHGTSEEFARESVRFLLQAFDGDRSGGITPTELQEAAGFRGMDLAELRSVQDWILRYDLMGVPGVAEVASVGGFVRQYQVVLDPDRLRAFDVDLRDVRRAIRRSNLDVGGRLLEMGETEYMVWGRGYLEGVEDLEQVPVGVVAQTHTPILLSQLGHVQVGPEMRRGLVDLNGDGEAVTGVVVLRYGENARAVIQRVEERLQELVPSLPAGVEVHVSYDRSELIDEAVGTLQMKLLEEILIVSAVCLVFLLHLRSALVAVVGLPVGVLGALLLMRLFGMNANIMSLGGIAIAIGVMVDASVVMVENLHKHRERRPHAPHREVVLSASKEVGPALFFSLAVITVSFLPVFTLEQQEGRLFTPLAFTKTFAMAVSALLAITLVPALMVDLVRGRMRPEHRNPLSRAAIAVYRPAIRAVLRFPRVTVGLAALVLLSTLWPYSRLGSEFMPPLNEGDLLYMPTTTPGISITEARELLQETDRIIAAHPQVEHVLGKVGRADTATDPAPLSMIETTIRLADPDTWPPGKTVEDIIDELDAAVQFPGLTNSWTMPIRARLDMLATGIRTPVGIKLLGQDLDVLAEVAEEVEAVVREIPGTASVFAERVTGGNYVEIDVDRRAAARYGLTVGDVLDVVRTAIGGQNVTWTVEGLERYPVNVRFPRELRDDLEALREVDVPTPMDHAVPLGQVAEIRVTRGPPAIKSENARRTAWIYVDLETDDVGGYVERAREAVRDRVRLPPGVVMEWSGQWTYMKRSQERLALVVPLTLVLVLILLYLHFRRVVPTLLVMGSLPFALVGGVWLLHLAGYNLSVAVAVGFIALAGLAAETGVVMLVYLDEARERFAREGRLTSVAGLREAILEGAVDRVRPKLMTVASTWLGLLPIMVGMGTGTRVMKRIAAPMVGGLLSSTLLTLVLIPALYLLVYRRRLRTGST